MIVRLTVEPVSVVAGTVVVDGVGDGDAVEVRVAVAVLDAAEAPNASVTFR